MSLRNFKVLKRSKLLGEVNFNDAVLIGHIHHSRTEWTRLQSNYKAYQFTGNRQQFLYKLSIWNLGQRYRTVPNQFHPRTGSLGPRAHQRPAVTEIWASKTPKVVAEATADAIAHRARAFGMSIVYHNRPRLLEDKEGDARYEMFVEHLGDDVVIINTARGSLLDEAAFVEALQAGKVASAGLDVFENEPVVHPAFCTTVMFLPHIGTTRESVRWSRCIENAPEKGKF
ncbi:uncharacterized protein BDW43DRAFT_300047 [Aspergillus alliaceus]|uniref:uncharacterized protein n=1 Tax=Petromyces alliaceus TaxID=209559 RepID=UPI0012A54656|nr:uncharacterized protein BDW43DRAFT_300047 [Aspergillus alliaceus]KAB8233803.1 hypothetical protein BDW43DRAFT_300047 [Aspergillus alliaceus]